MKIVEERERGVVVVRPSGRLDSNHSPELERSLLGMLERGDRHLVVDMAGVPYVSSRGLRLFLVVARKAQELDGRVAVCSLQEFVRKVFEVSGFLEVLGVFDTCSQATESLRAC